MKHIFDVIIFHYTNKVLGGHVSSCGASNSRLKMSPHATVLPWVKNAFLSPLFFLRFLILRFYFFPFFTFLLLFRIPLICSLSPSFLCSLSPLCSRTFSDVVSFQTPWRPVGFLALCVKASIFLCSRAFVAVLPPPFLIFISKLHGYRFVFLLGFPSSDSSMFSFFYTSICICMRFLISVFSFFNARLLFLLKLRFLSQKASIFISKLHVHKFVFLLRFLAWFSLIRFFYVFFFLPLFAFACVFSFRFFVFSLHVHCFF